MRVACVQTSPGFGSVTGNITAAHGFIERVKEADLVVLPELFHSGYMIRDRSEAEAHAVSRDKPSEPLEMCLDACRKFGMHVVGGFLEIDDRRRLYNSAWLISADGVVSVYRKVHLFNLEKDVFAAGDTPAVVEKIRTAKKGVSVRIGMQVCFDWIFPDGWGKLAWGDGGNNGVQVIAHPVNLVIPDKCPLAIRTRAVENRVFIVSAGRIGVDPGPEGELIFRGGSQIVSPDGEVLAGIPEDRTGCEMVEIDPALADNKHITPRNNILDERFGSSEGEQI